MLLPLALQSFLTKGAHCWSWKTAKQWPWEVTVELWPLKLQGSRRNLSTCVFLVFFLKWGLRLPVSQLNPAKPGIFFSRFQVSSSKGELERQKWHLAASCRGWNNLRCTQNIYHNRKEMHEHLFMSSEIYFSVCFHLPKWSKPSTKT